MGRIKSIRRLPILTALIAAGSLVSVPQVASGGAAVSAFSTPRPVAMIATPPSMLAACRRNSLLRPICPTQIPVGGSARDATHGYYCMTRDLRRETARQMLILFQTSRCMFAEWSYDNGDGLHAFTVGRQLWGWDGRGWVADEWSMLPPPLHVGIDIQASVGSPRNPPVRAGSRPQNARTLTDALLDPARDRPVSLGWVSWRGIRGQLVLTPRGPCGTGDELVSYLPPNAQGVSYTITLDAWMPTIRLTGPYFDRVLRVQLGPPLPREISTLERVVESVPAADLEPRGRGQS